MGLGKVSQGEHHPRDNVLRKPPKKKRLVFIGIGSLHNVPALPDETLLHVMSGGNERNLPLIGKPFQ